MIDSYLKNTLELDDHVIHLLYSANRWELKKQLMNYLEQGVTVISDRYAYSGVAFTSAKENPELDVEWCKNTDRGLPEPDLVIFLDLSVDSASKRGNYGEERYEKLGFQKKVYRQFQKLKEDNWEMIDASMDADAVGKCLFKPYIV